MPAIRAMYRRSLFTGLLLAVLAPQIAAAAQVPGQATKVTEIYTFADYGGGDILVKLAWHHANCSDGYWMSQSQPGFDPTLSQLLSALVAGTDVIVSAWDHEIWAGSSGTYCKVYYVRQLAP